MSDPARPRVLVVDDEPINLRVLAELLEPHCEVQVAKDAMRALALAAASNPPDLILLDITMPEVDGYEACARLKANPRTAEIPVIFVTSHSEAADEERGLELGAVDYVTKPVNPAIVLARIRTHIGLKRKIDLLASLAFLDGLTELPNRRSFDESMSRELRTCATSGRAFALAIFDIDHFKRVNDTHGHTAGDECLAQVARILKSELDGYFVARLGGEEFAALLPGAEVDTALSACERVRAAVAARPISLPFSNASFSVTISGGVAVAMPGVAATAATLYEVADAELYRCKTGGRNRVGGRTLVTSP